MHTGHKGVATSYLSSLDAGNTIDATIRRSHPLFHLPADPETTPMVLVCAGTGIAPFRGFIQERAMMAKAGRVLAPAVMYFGCRGPTKDNLYHEDFERWENMNVVQVKRAFSRQNDSARSARYVQDAMLADRDELRVLWKQGAILYICGSQSMCKGVQEAIMQIKKDAARAKGEDLDHEDVQQWWAALRNVRYVIDVFN